MVEDLSYLYIYSSWKQKAFFPPFSVFRYVTEVGKKSYSTKRTIGSPNLKKKHKMHF